MEMLGKASDKFRSHKNNSRWVWNPQYILLSTNNSGANKCAFSLLGYALVVAVRF